MDLDTADVDDLVVALADRFRRHRINRKAARHITDEMLTSAFDELEEFEDRSRITVGPLLTKIFKSRS